MAIPTQKKVTIGYKMLHVLCTRLGVGCANCLFTVPFAQGFENLTGKILNEKRLYNKHMYNFMTYKFTEITSIKTCKIPVLIYELSMKQFRLILHEINIITYYTFAYLGKNSMYFI